MFEFLIILFMLYRCYYKGLRIKFKGIALALFILYLLKNSIFARRLHTK